MTPTVVTPTTAAGRRFCEGPRPTGNWWKGVPDQIAAIEAEAAQGAYDDGVLDGYMKGQAVSEPAPLDAPWFTPHPWQSDGNATCVVCGHGPGRAIHDVAPDPAPLDVERLARALADLMCWTSHGTRPPRHRPCEPHLSRATQMAQSWREDWSPIRLAPEEAKP